MSFDANEPRCERIWFDQECLWVKLTDGRKLGVPLAYFPRLANATPQQRENFAISGGGTGLHWDKLDEDISVEGLFAGTKPKTAGP